MPEPIAPGSPGLPPDVGVRELQDQIRALYGARDRERGVHETFGWFVEEVGELSRSLRRGDLENRVEEFSDVLAWLVTLADLADIDLAATMQRYVGGCPKCAATPCVC